MRGIVFNLPFFTMEINNRGTCFPLLCSEIYFQDDIKKTHNDETLVSSSNDEKKEGTSAHYFGFSLFRVKSPCFLMS